MVREIACPHCGTLVSVDDLHSHDGPPPLQATVEIVVPATISEGDLDLVRQAEALLPASGSGSGAEEVPLPDRPAFASSAEVSAISLGSSSASGEVVATATPPGLLGFVAGPLSSSEVRDDGSGPQAGPESRLPALDFAVASLLPTTEGPAESPGDRADEDEPRGMPWAIVLLGSYASAMTLAVAYLLWFAPKRVAPHDTLPTDSRPDLGGRSGRRAVAAPIPRDHLAGLGRPLTVGDLEVTPVRVEVGRARLRRLNPDSDGEEVEGDGDSLILRLRLRNLSGADTFAPLDPAFVREPDRGLPDSYIELDGGGLLEIYRLAVESEMSIVGQSFEPLGPGERRETLIFSDPGTAPLAKAAKEPMTWRVRLRTGPDRTDVIGVRLAPDEIP